MVDNGKENKGFYISHSLEVFIWLLVLFFLFFVSSLGITFKEHNDENDYQILLQDVDGLIVGSPVRMMGIQVGHVVKIEPVKDEVYVKFILTNPDVYIPQGTQVTVEFTGLAGSKSLELYLPQNGEYIDKATPIIIVNSPKRLHDSLGLLNNMFKKLDSIIYTTSDFGNKIQNKGINSIKINTSAGNMEDFIRFSNSFLEDSNRKATDIRKSLEGLKKHAE